MYSITSSSNPKLKNAIRLHESRGRKMQNRIIVFGKSEIRRAHANQIEFVEIFGCQEMWSAETRLLVNELESSSANVYDLPKELFGKLAFGHRTDGIVAIAKRPRTHLDGFQASENGCVVVMEAIEKPGNIGAVFRSATAAGVDAIFLASPVCDVFHPNSIRSSLGTVFSTPVFCAGSESVKEVLEKNDFQLLATRVDAKSTFTEIDMTGRTAMIMGSEANGLTNVWSGPSITPVIIPMQGEVDSLNIAMTSTLMVFEARRQRGSR